MTAPDTDDAGLREAIAIALCISPWDLYREDQKSIFRRQADALLAGPLAPILAETAALRLSLETVTRERDRYRTACRQAGVCMSCALGAPDPIGCTDCFGTGWANDAPAGFVAEETSEGYRSGWVECQRLRAEEGDSQEQAEIALAYAWNAVSTHEGISVSVEMDQAATDAWSRLCALLDPLVQLYLPRENTDVAG